MLDENLPAFFYKKSTDGVQHHTAIFGSYQGSEPAPLYTLQRPDPGSAQARNCYAAALFDCHNSEVLYGETLIGPDWTQPSLSQEDIRRNGGIPPPPEPVRPTEFTVQLYNPDQQVVVRQKVGSWGGSSSYEFAMPQTTFRQPSASTLDRTQNDPAASSTTPKLNFVWRKESKLSKDYICYMTGKSTDGIIKKKHRDPDIAIALYRSLREITIYEPNLYRVDMEDPKGLEVVLLLSAAVIKDIYAGSIVKEIFNIQDSPTRKLSGGGRKMSNPSGTAQNLPTASNFIAPLATTAPQTLKSRASRMLRNDSATAAPPRPPHLPDPRAQWELDAETARIKAQTEAEERESKARASARRREQERVNEAETRRLRKMVEAEERDARNKQEAVDRETQRLRQQFGQGLQAPAQPPRPVSGPPNTGARVRPNSNQHLQPRPHAQPPRLGSNGLYLQPGGHASTSALMSGANGAAGPLSQQGQKLKKKSFWGLKSVSEDTPRTLSKKGSAMW